MGRRYNPRRSTGWWKAVIAEQQKQIEAIKSTAETAVKLAGASVALAARQPAPARKPRPVPRGRPRRFTDEELADYHAAIIAEHEACADTDDFDGSLSMHKLAFKMLTEGIEQLAYRLSVGDVPSGYVRTGSCGLL